MAEPPTVHSIANKLPRNFKILRQSSFTKKEIIVGGCRDNITCYVYIPLTTLITLTFLTIFLTQLVILTFAERFQIIHPHAVIN